LCAGAALGVVRGVCLQYSWTCRRRHSEDGEFVDYDEDEEEYEYNSMDSEDKEGVVMEAE